MGRWPQDLRHAARALRTHPGFVAIAVLLIGLSSGAATSVFSLVNGVLLRARPGIASPAALVDVGRTQDGEGFDNFSYPNYRDYRDRNTVFSGLAAYQLTPGAIHLEGAQGAERVFATLVSGNYFEVLGVQPAIGRFFLPEEDGGGGAPVAVLSHRLWQERFASDPGAVGAPLRLNGQVFTVVGVAAAGFAGSSFLASDLWLPIATQPAAFPSAGDMLGRREAVWLVGIGRLQPGTAFPAASAAMGLLARQLEEAYPDVNEGKGVVLLPSSRVPGDFGQLVRRFSAILMAIVVLVVLVASLNLAGMLIARAAARRRELAVRQALGAGCARLVRLLMTEMAVLALLGGAAGLLLSLWMTPLLRALLPQAPLPVLVDIAPDWRVVAFALLLPVVTVGLAALVPALQAARAEVIEGLKDAATAGRARLRSVLAVAQVALSLLLVVAAGLLLRALDRAAKIDPGFDPDGVQVVSLDLSLAGLDDETGPVVLDRLREEIAALPGVASVATAADLPLDLSGLGLGGIVVPGRLPPDGEDSFSADWNVVSPGYFRTVGPRLLRGRDFGAEDVRGGARVAIVNETAAASLWPDEEALGKEFQNQGAPVRVIGVAANAKYRSLAEAPRLFVYVPASQTYMPRLSLLARSEPAAFYPAVRELVRRADPRLAIVTARPLTEIAALQMMPLRLAASVAGSLGGFALLLSALGLYGVCAWSVTRRTREIGVRVTLGASPAAIARIIALEGLRLAALGCVAGLLGALAAVRLISSLLFGMSAFDPAAFVAGAVVLAAVASIACWLPARRAARLDPVRALRWE